MEQPTGTPKHRGTIIVDTNALFDLRAEVPIEFTRGEQSHKRFMEIIPFLGKHGFDVLIPEEVVFEITRHVVMPDGKTLKNIAPYLEHEKQTASGDDDDEQAKQPRFSERRGFIHQFSQALADKITGVHILSSAGLERNGATGFVASIRDIVEHHPHPDTQAGKRIGDILHGHSLRDMADKVMIAHLRRFAKKPKNGAVYVLTNDRNHISHIVDKLGSADNIRVLDVAGFTKALQENHLFGQFGVEDKIPYQPIVVHMVKRHGEYTGGNGNSPVGHIDSSCKAGKSQHGYLNDHPFAAAMRELARDLAAAHGQNGAVDNTNGSVSTSHASRLEGRTGKGVHVAPKTDKPTSL